MTHIPSITKQGWDATLIPETIRHYNSGLIEWKDKTLLCTRFMKPDGFCQLKWRQIKDGGVIDLKGLKLPIAHDKEEYEDARLFTHEGRLYTTYTKGDYRKASYHSEQELCLLTTALQPEKRWTIPYGGHLTKKLSEKNWQFFSHEGDLHFIYNIEPHVVVKLNENMLPIKEYKTGGGIRWRWGTMRGGTPPIRIQDSTYGDVYLSFFHGHVSHPKRFRRYNMSAYLFKAEAPFEIVAISKPLLIASEEDPTLPNLSNSLWEPVVIFPTGAILNDGLWTVSAGVNDSYDALIKIPHDKIPWEPVEYWKQPWHRYFHTINATLPIKTAARDFAYWERIEGEYPTEGVLDTSAPEVAENALSKPGVTEIDKKTFEELYGKRSRLQSGSRIAV